MILTREQIDALHGLAQHAECWVCDLVDTARAYHDLRDGVTGLADEWSRDGDDWTPVTLRAVVARVEES